MPLLQLVVSGHPDPVLAKTLAQEVSECTTRILHKVADHAAVIVTFVPPSEWVVGGRSLEEAGLSSFWLDVKVTGRTNTRGEKAAFLAEVFVAMSRILGPLHVASYIMVHEVAADSYGFGGVSQEQRYRMRAAAGFL
jgi:4-oxalocrotonate tautomerase